ncbi:MAG: HD domain-containing phosphohydrolase [bacterium]
MPIDSYRRLQQIIENFQGFLYEIEFGTSKVLFLEGKIEEITGYTKEDFYSGKIIWRDLIHPQDLSRIEEERNKLLSIPNCTARSEYRIINKDNDIRWVFDVTILLKDEEKIILQGYVQDITEKKQIELALKKEEEFLSSIFNAIQDGLSVVDRDLNIVRVNDKMVQLYPHMAPLEGKKCYFAFHQRDTICSFCPTIRAMETNSLSSAIVPYVGPEGAKGWLELYSYPLHNHNGSIIGVVEHVRDITEKKELEERLRFLSFHDILTGLYNRAFFYEELRRLDTPRSLPLGILMGDVNGLKLVNDVFGHEEGDKFLIEAGKLLKMSCRKEDIIARWGGDEFVILFPNITEEILNSIVERIYKNSQLSDPIPIPLSISVGYAIKYTYEKPIEEVLKDAEDNMYKRKLAESRQIRQSIMQFLLDKLREVTYESDEHIREVEELSNKFGKVLGLSGRELENLILAARLHDIGMIIVPREILEKGHLSQEEWEVIKKHPSAGYRIVQSVPELAGIAEYILCHHERWDGSGYPQGLKDYNIPFLSRIISIVDAFVSMRSERPYREAIPLEKAIEEIRRCSGSQFDPRLVEVFLEKVVKR